MRLKKAALFVTDRCNLRCDYCYESHNLGRSIDAHLARKSLDFLFSNAQQHLSLSFFGGEPLVRMDLLKDLLIYSQSKARELERSLSLLINTNGTLLTTENLEILARHRVFIVLSLDGSPETHDLHRKTASGGSSFAAIRKNLPFILRYPSLHVRMTVTPDTVAKLYSNIRFIREVGFRTLGFALNRESALWDEEALARLEEEYEKISDWYVDSIRKGINFRMVDIDLYIAKGEKKLKRGRPPCSAGESSIAIGPDGKVYPCHRFVDYEEARIGGIEEGIDEEKAKAFREYDAYKVAGCEDCELLSECYKCMWLSFVKHGDIAMKVDTACRESEIFIRSAARIKKVISEEGMSEYLERFFSFPGP